jgi:hypothetical protein
MGMGWFRDNAPWLFSGIGVAVLGWVGWGFYRMALGGRQSRVTKAPRDERDAHSLKTPPEMSAPSKALTAAGIVRRIQSAPLLQQAEVAAHYVGLSVQWDTTLVGAQRDEDGSVRLHLSHESVDGECGVFADVQFYPGLGILIQGHKIAVTGRIANAARGYVVLEDATIQFEPL